MPDQTECRYDLFVSFTDSDREWVEGFLLPALALPLSRVVTSQRTKSSESFQLGAPVVKEFERAVIESRFTLLLLSRAYFADQWSAFGEQLASYATVAEQKERLIAVLLDRDCPLPLHIEFRVNLDCTKQTNWEVEIGRLRQLLAQPEPKLERIACPYPGMIPFKKEDARFFYGRETEIRQMLQHFRNQRLLFVVGPSGCGKSSLLFAGLMPQLQTSAYFHEGFWLVKQMRPGPHPLQELRTVIGGDASSESITKLLAANPPAQRLLLAIDQFEELFSQAERSEQSGFLTEMKTLRRVQNCALLITMRADFYPELMNSEVWDEASSHRMEIAPLRGTALRAAIEKPAGDVDVYIEKGLVDRLVSDAAEEPGALPLLQETMRLLWAEMARRFLTLDTYERLGVGDHSGLAVAIANKADATLNDLPTAEQKAIARRIFLRLVQFGEGRPDTRRQQLLSSLRSERDDPHLFDQVLGYLEKNRLLIVTGEEGESERQIDLAHEALISGWPQLQQWAKERRGTEQTRRRLEDKAEEWLRLQRRGGLLDEVEIKEAEQWLQGPDAAELGGEGRSVQELLQASNDALKAAAEERVSYVRQLEVERDRATRHARLATARELAMAASSVLSADPELSVLLALEAVSATRRDEGRAIPEAENVLHAAVRSSFVRLTISGHTAAVDRVAFNLTSDLLATVGRDGIVRIWDAHSGDRISDLSVEDIALRGAAFGSGDRIAAVGWKMHQGEPSITKVWDRSGREILTVENIEGQARTVAFSPHSDSIAIGTSKGLAILDVQTERCDFALRGLGVQDIAYHPHRDHIVCGIDGGGGAVIWECQLRKELYVLSRGDSLDGISLSKDGSLLATVPFVGPQPTIFDLKSAEELWSVPGEWITDVTFGLHNNIVIVSHGDGTVTVWDHRSKKQLLTLAGHTNKVNSVASSSVEQRVATASEDGSVRVWELCETHEQRMLPLSADCDAVAFSKNWKFLAATGANGEKSKVELVNIDEPERARLVINSELDEVNDIDFNEDQTQVAIAARNYPDINYLGRGRASVWQIDPFKSLFTVDHGNAIADVEFSKDGTRLATASWDGSAKIWNAVSGEELFSLDAGSTVRAVSFSPDSKLIVTGSDDHKVRVWNALSGTLLRTLEGHTDGIQCVAFSPKGDIFATGSADRSARLWAAQSGQPLQSLTGHTREISTIAFSSDNSRLATGSLDGTAKLWELTSGTEVLTLRHSTSKILRVSFSADGRYLGVAGHSAQIYCLWIDDLIRLAKKRVSRSLTDHEREKYLHSESSTVPDVTDGDLRGETRKR